MNEVLFKNFQSSGIALVATFLSWLITGDLGEGMFFGGLALALMSWFIDVRFVFSTILLMACVFTQNPWAILLGIGFPALIAADYRDDGESEKFISLWFASIPGVGLLTKLWR